MTYNFEVSAIVPASPEQVYETWLSSSGHTAMTGADASVDPRVGGNYDAWDGYITGRTIALDPGRRIVQSWRTADFTEEDLDSEIDVLFEAVDEGTRVTINHSDVPALQRGYEEGGWEDSYFVPMREYFAAS
ncbi:SRPBCC domain-containing protein [Cryobacterium sp. PH31-AA6]|uniref:SRPBCC domain-containing protein n=1 Tax=Cryobacterium sp. PH31-AA6 TaxID=3046205 RepID=UPI0024BA711A|nr:SRPBCC domain-containing protein [Cryobacterium sp. PH31-AA6]MDJ0322413.1 SRPBCC domain-containing protein [Cryobacterium sp. PH31-AA6]